MTAVRCEPPHPLFHIILVFLHVTLFIGRDWLKKPHTAARGWRTRHAKSLASLNSRVDLDRITLEDAIDLFDKQLESLDLAQAEYEMQLDLEQIEKEIEGAEDYRENARTHRIEAARLLATFAEKTKGNSMRMWTQHLKFNLI